MLNAKALHVGLKHGMGTKAMIEKFAFGSQEELFSRIRRVAPQNAEQFIKKLKENQRKIDKKANTSNEEVGAQLQQQEVLLPEESSHVLEATVSEEAVAAISVQTEQQSRIAQLQELESELSALCIDKEREHKEMMKERREIASQLRNQQNVLREIQRLLKANQEKVLSLSKEYQEIGANMREVSTEISANKQRLMEVREEILELKRVSIFFYGDGDIEVENGEMPSISEENIARWFEKLITQSECEQFTIRVIKSLAKLHGMAKYYEQHGLRYELIFDNDKVQAFWDTLDSLLS